MGPPRGAQRAQSEAGPAHPSSPNMTFSLGCQIPALQLEHLQQHEHAVEGEACYYHCVLCSYSTKAKLNLIQHVRSMKHQRSESLRKLQRLQKGLPEEEEDLSAIFTIRKCSSSDTAGTEGNTLSRLTKWISPSLGPQMAGALDRRAVTAWFPNDPPEEIPLRGSLGRSKPKPRHRLLCRSLPAKDASPPRHSPTPAQVAVCSLVGFYLSKK
ncbi:hypothetical protein NHX12_005184 [Muraenolepis orangiensis]|uniref:C2H2-type domain-containing protein n=1 Tax=Muraenolepis orangiensis TaxID=630683 RepID=A0A9Q0DSG8_9TELE|nr:hypothetical protein NHX12_005184 [Muraenolepis orangiensis]